MRLTRRGRKRLIVLSIGLFLVAIGLVAILVVRSAMRGREIDAARESGLRRFAAGEFDEARPELQYVYDALGPDERDAEVAFSLAEIIWRQTESSTEARYAIELLDKVSLWEPDNIVAQERILDLAILLRLEERIGRTVEALLRRDPRHARALELLAQLPESVLDAARLRENMVRLGLEPDRFASRGELRRRLGRFLVEVDPASIAWRVIALDTLRDDGLTAVEILEQVQLWCEDEPERAALWLLAARAAMDAGEQDAARTALVAAAERPIDGRELLTDILATAELLNLDATAERIGAADVTTPLVARLRAENPEAAWVDLAVIERAWRGRHVESAQIAAEALAPAGASERLEALRWRAILAQERGDTDRCSRVLDELERELLEAPAAPGAGASAGLSDDFAFDRLWLAAFRLRVDPSATPASELAAWRAALQERADDTTAFLFAGTLERACEPNEALMVYDDLARRELSWVGLGTARGRVLLELNDAGGAVRAVFPFIARGADDTLPLTITLLEAWLQGGRGQGFDRFRILDVAASTHDATGWHWRVTPAYATVLALLVHNDDARALAGAALDDPGAHGDVLAALLPVSSGLGWGLEEDLARAARERPFSVRGLERLTDWMIEGGGLDAAVRVADAARTASFERDEDRRAAEHLALGLRLRAGVDGAADAIERTVAATDDVAWIAELIDDPVTWEHVDLAAACVARLRTLCGAFVTRVALGEARLAYVRAGETPAAAVDALAVVEPIARTAAFRRHRVAHLLAAELYLRSAPPQSKAALDALETVLRYEPRNVALVERIVAVARDANEHDRAAAAIRRLESAAGTDLAAARRAAELWLVVGDRRAARDAYRRFALVQGTDDDRVRLATLLFEMGEAEDAARLLAGIAATGHLPAIRAAADIAAAEGDWERAVSMLERIDGSDLERAVRLAEFERRHGRSDDAAERLRTVLAVHGDDEQSAEAWIELARTLLLRPDDAESLGEAEAALQRAHTHALATESADPALRARMASTLLALSGLLPERSDALAAMAEDLGGAAPYLSRAVALVKSRSTPDAAALREATALTEAWPEVVALWRLAIDLHALAGNLQEAATLAGKAIERFPLDGSLRRTRTRLLLSADRPTDALDAAEAWRRAVPNDRYEADVMIAAIELDLGRDADAWATISAHAPRIASDWGGDPSATRIWLESALRAAAWDDVRAPMSQLLSAEPDRVADCVDAWPRLHPTRLAGWAQIVAAHLTPDEVLARLAARAGESDVPADTARIYEVMRGLDADNGIILNNLAHAMVEARGDCRLAVTHAERAVDLVPDEPAILDTLARAFLCAGEDDRADTTARAAVAARPDAPAYHVTLAEILDAQGDPTGARAEADQARALLRGVPEREDLVRRLQRVGG